MSALGCSTSTVPDASEPCALQSSLSGAQVQIFYPYPYLGW